MRSTRIGRVITIVAAFVLTSCSFSRSQPRFRTQEDVGSVQVGVQSVAPFEDYISSLEPQFELKPQQALERAIAQTQIEDSSLVNQFLATLQIALPQITRSKTSSETNDGTTTTSTSTATHSSTPGTTTASTPPAVLTPSVTTTLPANPSVDLDSALRYRAATALAQEVALLNHYVRNAAVRTGTKPYIVRLLVTVMPGARNQPYDAYTTISFFTPKLQPIPPIRSVFYDSLYQLRTKKPKEAAAVDATTALQTMQKEKCKEDSPVNVIPLLVTDDLESSLHSDALQRIRDIAVALQGTLSNIGISSGSRSHSEELDKTINRNLNSIFALGQPAPNAVVARLGAAYANGKYVTVPRTYGVTLLVLVKTAAAYESGDGSGNEAIPCPTIAFNAVTQMHDAGGRGFVASRPESARNRELKQLLAAKGIAMTDDNIIDMLKAAASGNFASIASLPDATLAWSDAVWVSQRSGRSTGDFVVSIPRVSLPSDADHFSLLDNGEVTTLSINHGANLLPDRLHANIKAQFTDRWIFLTNTDVKVGGYGRTAVFTFPSLNKIMKANAPPPAEKAAEATPDKKTSKKKTPAKGREPKPSETKEAKTTPLPESKLEHVYAEVVYGRGLNSWSASGDPELQWYPMIDEGQSRDALEQAAVDAKVIAKYEAPISYVLTEKKPKEAPEAGFTVSVPAAVIAALDGTGKMLVEVRNDDPDDPKEVHLQILEGGFISKDSEPELKGADHIAAAGAWLLSLNGLRPGTPLVLHAFRMEGAKPVSVSDTPVQVIAATPPPEPKKPIERP